MRTPFTVAPGNRSDSHHDSRGRRLRRFVASAAAVAAVVASAAAGGTPGTAAAAGQSLAGSVPAPSATEVSPQCATVTPSTVLGPASTSVPKTPVTTVVTPPGGVASMAATGSDLYVVNAASPATLYVYTLAGAAVTNFALPSGFNGAGEVSQPVVDSSGNIYLSSYYGQRVDKFSSTGTLVWSVDPSNGNPTNVFLAGAGASAQLVVSLVQGTSSVVLNQSTGATGAAFPFYAPVGAFLTTEASGNVLASANGYVRTVSPAGAVLATFGSSGTAGSGVHTGGPYQFYYTGQADQGPDGTVYTSDPLGTVEATSPAGLLEGRTTLGGALTFGTWGMQLSGSSFYFASGQAFNGSADAISTFSLASLQAYLGAPAPATDALGWGAGLSTPAVGQYFAPGVAPVVDADFDAWWASGSSQLSLAYSVENQTSMNSESVPTPTTIVLPTTAAALASVNLPIPAQDTLPGPYQVQATLENTSTTPPTVLGTTCLPYTVGAGSDSLNLAGLPVGAGGGGPTDVRGVPLSQQLGLDGLRSGTDANWSALLPSCNFSAPTAAACGSSAMNLSAAPLSPYQAAYEAAADHVTYWYQVSGGESTDTALVNAGLWGQDVQALVAHYATVPSGCGACSPVTMWEPWNESNNTGWSSGATYTTSVLIPFYNAVKAVLPGSTSTVLGGSSLEPSPAWWNQLIGAGGLAYMDVAAMHPYTGSNDSWEEDGMISQIQQLQAALGSKPLWFTEVGWWSDGDYNYLEQADIVARAEIWMKILHIPVWGYFFSEGNWGNDGVSFSLVQVGCTGDDYVKPAALASMESAQQLGGRSATSQPATGIPQTYQADFGPAGSGSTDLAAIWSDGLNTTGAVTVTGSGSTAPVTVTDQYGNATTSTVALGSTYSLPISDQVAYVTYPVGDTLTVAAPQAYGANLALSSAGASASATSQNTSNGNYAIDAIVGLTAGYGQGWESNSGDVAPALTVTWPTATTVNRVVVDTQSVGSTAPGLRNYTVALDESGSWTTVATETGEFRDHQQLVAVTPASATGVRITVSEVDFGGYDGGGIPPWWSATTPAAAFVHAVQVYAGTGTPAQVGGSGLVPLTTGSTAPATPTGLVATAGDGQVALSWGTVSGATGYTVYKNGTAVGTVTSASDTVTGLTDGTTYSFTVAATASGGTSAPSGAVAATPEPAAPAVPTGLVATAGDGRVGLTWTPVAGATGYRVYANGGSVGTVTSASDTVTGLTDGTTYSFTVAATNGGGSSAQSGAVTATPEPPVPAVPCGLVATPGDGQVTVSWGAVSGATGYVVDVNGVSVGAVTSTSDTVTGLTDGTSYSFTVAATNGGGSSAQSGAVTATPEPPVPAVPTGVVATAGDGQVVVSWGAVSGAAGYVVYVNGSPLGTFLSTSDTVTGLTDGTMYSFTVAATNGGGSSAQSAAAVGTPEPVAPAAPTGVVATAGDGQAVLTWTPVSGATGYRVFENGTSVATVTSASDTVADLTDGTTYNFTVAATNGGGSSAQSGAVTATPEPPVPAVPTGVVATAGDGQVAVSWGAVSGAAGYVVYVNGSPLGTFLATSDTVNGLTDGTTYSFTVAATNGGGSSAQSGAVWATPEPPVPAVPTGLVATPGDGQVGLNWTAVTGATGYTVSANGTPAGTVTSASDTVTGLTDGTTYRFTVAATNGGGSSAQSGAVTATPEPPVPAVPTGLVATGVSSSGATLSWTASTGASSYAVYANGTRVATPTAPTAALTGLQPGTPYSLTVTATDAGGTSAVSTALPIITTPGSPSLRVKSYVATLTFTGDTAAGGPTWSVLNNGTAVTGVTYAVSGSTVRATIRNLRQGTLYNFAVQGILAGVRSPATAPISFLSRSTATVTTAGTVQTLSWTATTSGLAWKVSGCSSTGTDCSDPTPVATGPITQVGETVMTTVSGCSPDLYYRYRVMGRDVVTQARKAGPLAAAVLG